MWRQIEIIGNDGFRTLGLATMVMLATGGLSSLWCFARVIATAIRTRADVTSPTLVVFGHRLRDGAVSRRFAERLDRAIALHGLFPARRILLLGGITGGASRSEADAGWVDLLEHGVTRDSIEVEDQSKHTLENLREAQGILGSEQNPPPVFVTSRDHLARIAAIAKGLRLKHRFCAAEDRFRPSIFTLVRALREAFFCTGTGWVSVGPSGPVREAIWIESLNRLRA